MNKHITIMVTGILLVATTPFACPLQGEMTQAATAEASRPAGSDDSTLTVSKVQSLIDDLAANENLQEPIKASLRQKYEQALESLQTASNYISQMREYESAIQSGSARIKKLQAELNALKTGDKAEQHHDSRSTLELQRALDTRRVSVELLRKQLADLGKESAQLEKRPVEIPTRLLEVQRELSGLQDSLASPELSAKEASVSSTAERVLLQAKANQLIEEKNMLEKEQLTLPIRSDMLEIQQAVLQEQIAIGESDFKRLNDELELRLANMAERLRRIANSVPAGTIQQSSAAEKLVNDLRALATELESETGEKKHLEELQDQYRQDRENLGVEFSDLKKQLDLNSNGEAIVQLLFNLDHRCQKTIKRLQENPLSGLEESQIGSLQVNEKLRAQSTLKQELGPKLSAQLQNLLNARREGLENLGRRYSGLTRSLALAEQQRQQYLNEVKEVRGYISETLLGFGLRACPPVTLGTFLALPESIAWSFQTAHWQEAVNALIAVFRDMPTLSLSVILISGVLLLFRVQIIGALELTGRRNKRISTDRYRNTCQALLWTFLLALPLPLLIGYLGWALGQEGGANDWFEGVKAGVRNAAWIVLAASFMSGVLRPGGLAHLHFAWNEARIAHIRHAVLRTAVVYVPALVLTISCTYGDASTYLKSLARVSFLIAHLWAFLQLLSLYLNTRRIVSPAAGSKKSRWSWLWFGSLSLVLLSLIIMMFIGYMITSLIWSLGVIITLVIIGAGSILNGLVLRWLSIRHRRLALEEAIERRRTQQATDSAADGPSEIVEVDAEETSEFSLEMIGEQTKQLLRSCCSLGVLISVLAYWTQVLPLDDVIGSVTLPLFGGLTLLAVSLTVLIVVVTLSIVKNLPGFLELIVFRSKNVPAGTRLAIYTLCQYGVMVVGIGAIANVLQVDWVKFGWIVTALSVGIGFGLQEVVANFVSGLILLLERPIRVGDIVTVEATTGTVKNIRLRATTITNWDRQELVVPNKTLVTNTLLNWTLSEPLNRILIPVGIAYGSDTERAQEILLAVASEHPNVLEDPEPMATFEQFADSSLSIVLRAYLPDLEARLLTISQLHTEINRRFADAGIEIAFPQRDLHLRSGWRGFAEITK